MKYLLFIGIVAFLFFNSGTIASKYGLNNIGTFYSLIFAFIFLVKLLTDRNKLFFSVYKDEVDIVIIGTTILLIKLYFGEFAQLNEVVNLLIMPMLLSFLLGSQNKSDIKIIKNLILIFFITECFLAIYERFFLINVFPNINLDDEVFIENWSFRSTSFLGNPLANALGVSTIMGFVIVSTMKIIYKLFYLTLGYVALMCFNGRMAMVIWATLALIYILNVIRKNNSKKIKLFGLIFMIVSTYLVYNLMMNYSVGYRIISNGVIDGSSKTRIDVFNSFHYLDSIDLWFGNSINYEKVGRKLGVNSVENPLIALILKYGVILTLIISILYLKWIKNLFNNFSHYHKFFVLSSFILLGSTNNGLTSSQPWFIFVICYYSFPVKPVNNYVRKFNYKLISNK